MNSLVNDVIYDFAFEALNAANDGIIIVDMKKKDQPIFFVNKAFEKLTGYSAQEIIGKNCRFLQGCLPPQPEIKSIRKALSEQNSCRVILKNMKKDGTFFWNELSLAPIKDKNGNLNYYIGIQKDVTQEIMNNQAIMYAFEQNKIHAMEGAISYFADKISQPLTAISIYSGACGLILEQEKVKLTKLHDGFEKVVAQTMVVKKIIRAIKNKFNELNFSIEKINPNDLILQLINTIKYSCPYHIEFHLDSQLPEIMINRMHLFEILLNLIENSIEAFHSNSQIEGKIIIGTKKIINFIQITISDNGPGIPKEFLNQESYPFFTSKAYGIGTGLEITKKLIDMNNGNISFKENNPGLSITITF